MNATATTRTVSKDAEAIIAACAAWHYVGRRIRVPLELLEHPETTTPSQVREAMYSAELVVKLANLDARQTIQELDAMRRQDEEIEGGTLETDEVRVFFLTIEEAEEAYRAALAAAQAASRVVEALQDLLD